MIEILSEENKRLQIDSEIKEDFNKENQMKKDLAWKMATSYTSGLL